jgi:hypothetical protein
MSEPVRRLTPPELERISRALISARDTNLGIEIELPVVYPNGQCVSVVVTVAGGNYVVHDAGIGAMSLTSAGVDLTKALAKKLARLGKDYGCEFVDGRMFRACTESQLPIAIALVANASRAVGDQSWESRERKIRDFRREVSLVLTRTLPKDRVRKLQVVGNSGTTYKVSHVVLSPDKAKQLAFVEPIPDQQTVDRKFREFWDIRSTDEYRNVERISVFDDRTPWRDGDLAMLGAVSNIVPCANFSRRLERLIA